MIEKQPQLPFTAHWTPKRDCHYALYKYKVNRGYYTVARRYEFYFRVAKQYFTHSLRSFVKYCFYHEKIKFISSSLRVMFFFITIDKKTSIK